MKAGPRIVIAMLLVTGMLAAGGCTSGSSDTLPQDKYVAIEERLVVNCTLINGTYPFYPHITISEPFNYDGTVNGSNWAEGSGWYNSKPRSGSYPVIDDRFKVLFGTSYYRDVAPGNTQTGLKISGVYSYPYIGDSGFTINSVDSNGTVYASYNGTMIILRQGKQWVSPTASEIREENYPTYAYSARFDSTWTISNLCVVDKQNLTRLKYQE